MDTNPKIQAAAKKTLDNLNKLKLQQNNTKSCKKPFSLGKDIT